MHIYIIFETFLNNKERIKYRALYSHILFSIVHELLLIDLPRLIFQFEAS